MADKTSTGPAAVTAAYTVVSGIATTAFPTAAPRVTTAARGCPRLLAAPGLALGHR